MFCFGVTVFFAVTVLHLAPRSSPDVSHLRFFTVLGAYALFGGLTLFGIVVFTAIVLKGS
jgi:hypothetical protein